MRRRCSHAGARLAHHPPPSRLKHHSPSVARSAWLASRCRTSSNAAHHPSTPTTTTRHHPKLNVLYVLSECIDTCGYLTAFSIDVASGALREIGRLSMTGKSTCYISFDKDARHAVITNYWDGIINVVQLDERTGAPLALVQEHQQTRREQWRQVEDRPVSHVAVDACMHA